jgi:hypothetical protein
LGWVCALMMTIRIILNEKENDEKFWRSGICSSPFWNGGMF